MPVKYEKLTHEILNVYGVYVCTCLVSQMIAGKYLNDEGEAESVLNSEWAKIGKSVIKAITYILVGSFQPTSDKHFMHNV